MRTHQLIRPSVVKQFAKELANGRGRNLQVSAQYLEALDAEVRAMVMRHVRRNGSHARLMADVFLTLENTQPNGRKK